MPANKPVGQMDSIDRNKSQVRVDVLALLEHTARAMTLRVVVAWIGLNVGALLLLAIVDVTRSARKRLLRRLARPQTAAPQR
jgi:hypothetical protein